MLPSVYHSAVSRLILEGIKARTGRVFHSMCPDAFTGYAVPVFAETARNVEENLTVLGASPKSNSGDGLTGNSTNLAEFAHEYDGYGLHDSLPDDIPFFVNCTTDSALVAMDLFPGFYGNLAFNYEAMWALYHRSYKDLSLFDIVNRRLTKQNRGLNALRFLYYRCCAHLSDQMSNTLSRKRTEQRLRRGMKALGAKGYPRDIAAAVEMIDQIVRPGCQR